MKYFVIFFIFVGFVGFASAEMDSSILEPFENNDLVIIGTVVTIDPNPSENKTQYNIKVDEYLKGKTSFDMVAALLDGMVPADFPADLLDYYNKPYFENGNQVLVYLKNDGGTYKMSPYSFTIKKPTVVGPPTIIHSTGPQDHFLSQGDEIIISGMIKKGYLYDLGKSGIDSSFQLSVLSKEGKQIESKKLTVSPDGSYAFVFQDNGEARIPGTYSWNITYENGRMGGEFVVVVDSEIWTPLKQFKSGVSFGEIQCKENLILVEKYDGFPACVKPETERRLTERGWIKNDAEPSYHLSSLSERFKNIPGVVAIYEMYDDVQVSVRDDHVSYFSGSDEGYFVIMNLFFDEDNEMVNIDFHCYFQRVHQFELPQEYIEQKIVKYDCKEYGKNKNSESKHVSSSAELEVDVSGQQQVRRGTTQDIVVDVSRDANPIPDALVRITIENYGEDVIRDFKGRTDDSGRFVFSWEIPKSFDDLETLLAYVDVTDDVSSKTILFKFQVYCLPGESGCRIAGN